MLINKTDLKLLFFPPHLGTRALFSHIQNHSIPNSSERSPQCLSLLVLLLSFNSLGWPNSARNLIKKIVGNNSPEQSPQCLFHLEWLLPDKDRCLFGILLSLSPTPAISGKSYFCLQNSILRSPECCQSSCPCPLQPALPHSSSHLAEFPAVLLIFAALIFVMMTNMQSSIKCCSAAAPLRAEQGPCEPSEDVVRKFGEQ